MIFNHRAFNYKRLKKKPMKKINEKYTNNTNERETLNEKKKKKYRFLINTWFNFISFDYKTNYTMLDFLLFFCNLIFCNITSPIYNSIHRIVCRLFLSGY